MNSLHSLWFRLQSLWRRKEIEHGLTQEIEIHLAMATEQLVARGLSPDEARAAARREFGAVEQMKEVYRDERGLRWLENLLADLRYAGRQCGNAPGFTAVAVLTLALAIGASTALYTVAEGIWFNPFPFRKSREIYSPTFRYNEGRASLAPIASDLPRIAALDGVQEAMGAGWRMEPMRNGAGLELGKVVYLTGNAFDFLGMAAHLGRTLGPGDIEPNGDIKPVVMLSYDAWQRLYQGNPGVLGETIELNRIRYTIVGVAVPRFRYKTGDVFVPLSVKPDPSRWINPFLRLKPGTSREVIVQELQALVRQIATEDPSRSYYKDATVSLPTIVDIGMAVGQITPSLKMLFVAVAFLLLIACANVANLQLARGAARGREIALRLALGASRGRLIRQLLTESIALAVLGGTLGALVAWGLTKLIMAIIPPTVVPGEAEVQLDGVVLGFALALSLLTGLISGLVPALQNTSADPNGTLKDGGQGSVGGIRGKRIRGALVITEIALAVMLVVGAAITVNRFRDLLRVDPGFNPVNTIALTMPVMWTGTNQSADQTAFSRRVLDEVVSLPGVISAAIGTLPFRDNFSRYVLVGQPPDPQALVSVNAVSADYRRTLGMRLVEGRDLTESECLGGAPVALINETAAKLWPHALDPIGQELLLRSLSANPTESWAATARHLRVVGVVADTHNESLTEPVPPAAFVPYSLTGMRHTTLIAKTVGEPGSVLNGLRARLQTLDPTRPLARPLAPAEIMEMQIAPRRFSMTLFSVLAGLSLCLAAVGIYSVISYSVSQRTREIGVRMALGAQPSDILNLVIADGSRLLLAGLAVGCGVSFLLSNVVRSQLFIITEPEPTLFAGALLTLVVIVLFACYLPSRRATGVDPIAALRSE